MKRLLVLAGIMAVILVIWLWPPGTWLVEDLKLDGCFEDWQGRAFLEDGREQGNQQDFKKLSWGTNPNDQKLYFMVETAPGGHVGQPLTCRLYFDINSNGSYDNPIDKFADLYYEPGLEDNGKVVVRLCSVQGETLATYQGLWGEGRQSGARHLELAIPMDELEVYPSQPIRFYLSGIGSSTDRLPGEGDNQWAPFPVTVKSRAAIAVGFLVWFIVAVFFHRSRIWVFYYIWGAVGISFLLILLLRGSFVEYQLERQTSLVLHYLLGYFDIVTYVFDKAPGTLLVVIKVDNSWTTIDIDIESSGLLEICILIGLIMFYPAYNQVRRIFYSALGVAAVYMINLMRLLIIVSVIHWGGRNMSFIAHTLLGRVFFFVLVVALYWQLLTRPTLKKIKENVKNA